MSHKHFSFVRVCFHHIPFIFFIIIIIIILLTLSVCCISIRTRNYIILLRSMTCRLFCVTFLFFNRKHNNLYFLCLSAVLLPSFRSLTLFLPIHLYNYFLLNGKCCCCDVKWRVWRHLKTGVKPDLMILQDIQTSQNKNYPRKQKKTTRKKEASAQSENQTV